MTAACLTARELYAAGRRKLNASTSLGESKAGLALLKRTAAPGSVEAHVWPAAAYDYGLGTRPNRRLALRHYQIAANSSNATAAVLMQTRRGREFWFARAAQL